jgi:hypothetical protein
MQTNVAATLRQMKKMPSGCEREGIFDQLVKITGCAGRS